MNVLAQMTCSFSSGMCQEEHPSCSFPLTLAAPSFACTTTHDDPSKEKKSGARNAHKAAKMRSLPGKGRELIRDMAEEGKGVNKEGKEEDEEEDEEGASKEESVDSQGSREQEGGIGKEKEEEIEAEEDAEAEEEDDADDEEEEEEEEVEEDNDEEKEEDTPREEAEGVEEADGRGGRGEPVTAFAAALMSGESTDDAGEETVVGLTVAVMGGGEAHTVPGGGAMFTEIFSAGSQPYKTKFLIVECAWKSQKKTTRR